VDYRREIELAVDLARRAGELIAGLQGGALAVEQKADDSPVTVADRLADALIVAGLRDHFPDDAVLSEEAPDDGTRLHKPRVWMVDPIDGTKDFIRGLDGYAVMIGLLDGDRPVVGVVYQPVAAKLYQARLGDGAWLSRGAGAPTRLQVSTIADLDKIRMVASRSHRTATIDRVRERLGISDELNVGSVGLKLGLIAEGVRDLYVNPSGHSKLWDTCGPEAILVEAGGRLSDAHGQPLRWRDPELGNVRGLIASNAIVHDAVVEKLAALFPSGSGGAVSG
jgi:3'(2'), 5'-bisphosphate nucleotidase